MRQNAKHAGCATLASIVGIISPITVRYRMSMGFLENRNEFFFNPSTRAQHATWLVCVRKSTMLHQLCIQLLQRIGGVHCGVSASCDASL